MKLFFALLALLLFSVNPQRQCFADAVFQGPFELVAGGANREAAKIYLPAHYSEHKQWPLVVSLHGYGGNGGKSEIYFGFRHRVTSRGFILVIPEGTKDIKGDRFWNATDSCCDMHHSNVDDSKYLFDLIAKAQAQYRVDASRVYIFGHSNGGFMANRLACDRGESIAGIASLAGAGFKNPADCRSREPVSMLQIHAKNDPTVKYAGEEDYPGAQDTTDQWLARNRCTSPMVVGSALDLTASIPGLDAETHLWKSCRADAEVALWTIKTYRAKGYKPHIPALSGEFTDRVLDFLLAQHR